MKNVIGWICIGLSIFTLGAVLGWNLAWRHCPVVRSYNSSEWRVTEEGLAAFCESRTGRDDYTCSLTPPLTALEYACVVLNVDTANLGMATLNVDKFGARNLYASNGSKLKDGEIKQNTPLRFCYNKNFPTLGQEGWFMVKDGYCTDDDPTLENLMDCWAIKGGKLQRIAPKSGPTNCRDLGDGRYVCDLPGSDPNTGAATFDLNELEAQRKRSGR